MATVEKVDQTTNSTTKDKLDAATSKPLVPAGAVTTTDHAHDTSAEQVALIRDEAPGAKARAKQAEDETKKARDAGERIPQPTNTEVAEGNTTVSDAYRADAEVVPTIEELNLARMRSAQMAPVAEVQDPSQPVNPAPLPGTEQVNVEALQAEVAMLRIGFAALFAQHPNTTFPVGERDVHRFSGAAVRYRTDPVRGGFQFFVEEGAPTEPGTLPFAVPAARQL